MSKEMSRELIRRDHVPHLHAHAHPPHHLPDLSQMGSSGDSSGLLAVMGASMAVHPVGWAIGGLAAAGVLAYLIFKD